MKICVDFDGTCVTHDYPNIGKDIGAVGALREIVARGHKLILFTMRSGKELDEAVAWFKFNKIKLYGIQKDPEQEGWTKSPKAYANIYIDDAALGCPTMYCEDISPRPFADWGRIMKWLRTNRNF